MVSTLLLAQEREDDPVKAVSARTAQRGQWHFVTGCRGAQHCSGTSGIDLQISALNHSELTASFLSICHWQSKLKRNYLKNKK